MRNVIVSEFVTLDGVMEDPGGAEGFEHGGWSIRLSSEEQQRFKFDELAAADALLLGRTTYEGFAAAWPGMMEGYDGPGRAELQDYAYMMNSYPKHVVSTTLTEPLEWRYRQMLWIRPHDHAAAFSSLPSTSSPFSNLAPALTNATK